MIPNTNTASPISHKKMNTNIHKNINNNHKQEAKKHTTMITITGKPAAAVVSDETSWPMDHIRVPGKNDVVFGRGGASIHHSGNKRYRQMVRSHQRQYIGYDTSRHMKTLLSHELVQEWRAQAPTGRFLKKDEATGEWCDVGTAMARRKTAQLLREGAKKIRQALREEEEEEDTEEEESENDASSVEEHETENNTVCIQLESPRKKARTEVVKIEPISVSSAAAAATVSTTASTTTMTTSTTTMALLTDLKSIVRSAPKSFFYDQKTSLEMLETVFEDILDDTTAGSTSSYDEYYRMAVWHV